MIPFVNSSKTATPDVFGGNIIVGVVYFLC